MADMSDSYPDTSAVDRDFKELGDDGMDMSYLDDMLNTRRRSAEEDEKSEQKAEARLDELERREREAEDLRERSGEASEDGGEHGGSGGHAPAAGSTSQVATAPSTQEVHPDRDEDADEQSAEIEETEEQQEETPEPVAAPTPEPAPAPKDPEPQQQAEPEPEVTIVERHPLVGHTLDAGALTERNGGVQLRLPETIVDAVRTVLASTGYEKVAQVARGKLVTAYIAATLGVDLEVEDKETLALLEALRGINPLLGGIETNVQLMLDQAEQMEGRMRQLDERLAKLQLIDESTEMGVAYLLMNSTAKHPEITRNKTAETIEVAHPMVEKLRKRSRAQVEPVMKNDKRTEGRPIR